MARRSKAPPRAAAGAEPPPPNTWRYRWPEGGADPKSSTYTVWELDFDGPEGQGPIRIVFSQDEAAGKTQSELEALADQRLRQLRLAERFISPQGAADLSQGLDLLDALAEQVAAATAEGIVRAYRDRAHEAGVDVAADALAGARRRTAEAIKGNVYPQLRSDPDEERLVQTYLWRQLVVEVLIELEQELVAQGHAGVVTLPWGTVADRLSAGLGEIDVAEAAGRLLPLYAHDHVRWYARAFDLETRPLGDLAEALGLGRGVREPEARYLTPAPPKLPSLPSSPDPFAAGRLAPFASGAPAFGAAKALFHARAWPEDEEGRRCFVHKVEGPRFRGIFEYRIIVPPDVTREEAALTHRELTERILSDMGADTVWMHMLFLAYSCQVAEGSPAAITRPMVYRALGLDRRTDLSRREKDERCDEEIRRLGSLGLTIVRAQLNGQELDYHKRSTVVWQITKDEYGQARFEPDGDRLVKKWEEWQLLVQPGAWAPTFLYREPLRQFGHLSPEMFNIDRRRAPWGVALAVLLAFEGRFSPQPRLRIQNRRIIDFADGNLTPATKDERRDTSQLLLNAIEEQVKWGWRPDYREWPAYLRPDLDADRADGIVGGDGSEATPRRRPRGYFDTLLDAATWFEMPAGIYTLNAGAAPATSRMGARRAQKRLAPPAPRSVSPRGSMMASDLKDLRQRLGLSQTALGERLGVSGAMVSFMEQGKRRIPPEVVGRVEGLAAAPGLNNGH